MPFHYYTRGSCQPPSTTFGWCWLSVPPFADGHCLQLSWHNQTPAPPQLLHFMHCLKLRTPDDEQALLGHKHMFPRAVPPTGAWPVLRRRQQASGRSWWCHGSLLSEHQSNIQDNQWWETMRPQSYPLLWAFSWLMHLYLLVTGQYFPVLPLAIQRWLWSPSILVGTDSSGGHRHHRCLRLLGLVLTWKVLSLLKYICYCSYAQLL